ncbi:MAG: hypothetical protein PHH08_01630 [Candidatus ainarchaeum sp.]|nr:hypothetical protein [Candidatus ainarchaeum sp.]
MPIIACIAAIFLPGCISDANPAPETPDCNSFSFETCPDSCVACPPCEVCSSISCRTEEFCKSIGFDRSWGEGIKERLKTQ